jgi:hypothetical protein
MTHLVFPVTLKINISFLYGINGLVFATDVHVFSEVKTSDIETDFISVLLLAPCQHHATN